MQPSQDTGAPPMLDQAAEIAALLAVHAADRGAHFETNVDLILEHADDEFIAVANGEIERQTRDEVAGGFAQSFRGATYLEWDDLEAPIMRVSADASMAWMIVRIRVRKTQDDGAGERRERAFIYAGIMTYEKRDGRWVRVANVSTFA